MNMDQPVSPHRRTRILPLWLAAIAVAVIVCPSRAETEPSSPDTPGLHALLDGRVDEAESILRATIASSPSDGYAHQLLCRVFYAQEQVDQAIHECELATTGDPRSSDNFLWLGRAYGMKARRANPLSAFALARKVHASFETAVQLNPANQEAIGDLGEYYVEAPAIVGGGDDKARALAARSLPQFPSAAHGLLASLAQSNKDYAAAEQELKLAVSSAKGNEAEAQAWMDLAHFYLSRNRGDDALNAVHSGLVLEHAHGAVLVDAARILTAMQREPAVAERCLRDYLAGHSHTDAAPVFKVHLQLARLLAARGDEAAASREIANANALAAGFHAEHAEQGI